MKKKVLSILLVFFAIVTTAYAQENTIDGHEYVDLGLPSGTLWATCNVGATKPEEYGLFFAWGETKPKDVYEFDSYFDKTWNKYNSSSLTELVLEDDAACVNWGSNWRMPNYNQIKELTDNCNWEWTTLNGVYGRKATSKKNGMLIFFPAAGYHYKTNLHRVGTSGFYWSRTLSTWFREYAKGLEFGDGQEDWYYLRCSGRSVRPVINMNFISDGIEVINREIGIHNDFYTIDGKKLNGEPKKKGLYIKNGKKVVK